MNDPNAPEDIGPGRPPMATRFQPGNPGRPKGILCGRAQALAILDQVVSDPAVKVRLGEALRAEFNKNPVRFFRTIIMPLLPKESIISTDTGPQVVVWHSLLKQVERGERPAILAHVPPLAHLAPAADG